MGPRGRPDASCGIRRVRGVLCARAPERAQHVGRGAAGQARGRPQRRQEGELELTPRATENRRQQVLVIRSRRNRRNSADCGLGGVSSTVPELPLSGEQTTIIRRARQQAARCGEGGRGGHRGREGGTVAPSTASNSTNTSPTFTAAAAAAASVRGFRGGSSLILVLVLLHAERMNA